MMHFNTGHSTVFEHCKTEGCLYHAISGELNCKKHCQHRSVGRGVGSRAVECLICGAIARDEVTDTVGHMVWETSDA